MRLMEKAHFHYRQGEDVPQALSRTAALLSAADCYVVVSSEHNHTLPPGLTNMMNFFGSSTYARKPSGIVTYSAGNWGGARAGVALRPFLSELGCLPVSAMLQLRGAWKAFDEDGRLLDPFLEKQADRMLDQLEWTAHALRNHRELTALQTD